MALNDWSKWWFDHVVDNFHRNRSSNWILVCQSDCIAVCSCVFNDDRPVDDYHRGYSRFKSLKQTIIEIITMIKFVIIHNNVNNKPLTLIGNTSSIKLTVTLTVTILSHFLCIQLNNRATIADCWIQNYRVVNLTRKYTWPFKSRMSRGCSAWHPFK